MRKAIVGELMIFILALAACTCASDITQRTQNFDSDPTWQGVDNRMVDANPPTITQDFGYSQTHFASHSPGEIGGGVWRSSTPASYALAIAPTTLDQPLNASGTVALLQSSGTGGVMFGWFNHDFTHGQRPTQSLLLHIGGQRDGAHMHLRVIDASNQSAGMMVGPRNVQKRDVLFAADGSIHRWSVNYDPQAGVVSVTFDDLPAVKLDVPAEIRKGLTVDRFGLLPEQKGGRPMKIYFGDLVLGGKPIDLSSDPKWIGEGNRVTFADQDLPAHQNFGFSNTHFAGGEKSGEIGGTIWRTDRAVSWYADSVGSLNLDQPLKASGKITLQVGAPDSGVMFGWFNSAARSSSAKEAANFIGAHIEGPTRVGHYFMPVFIDAAGQRAKVKSAAVLVPDGKSHDFVIEYTPDDKGGGEVQTTLDGQTTTLHISPADRKAGATFDRFGFLSVRAGGQKVTIYVDDLEYTAAK